MPDALIGRGKAARVYKIGRSPYAYTRKEFSPIHHVKLWNWFFYNSWHPLTTKTGHKYAYWKRRLAHRLCKFLDCNIHIPDALQLSSNGFTLRYIEGSVPRLKDKRLVYKITKKLEDFFNSIGMPTWSFSRRNPFSRSNFVLKDGAIYIIDYEQSVPVPDSKGKIGYDAIYFDKVHNFIADNKQRLLDKLGEHEMQRLVEAFQLSRECYTNLDIRPKVITKFINRK